MSTNTQYQGVPGYAPPPKKKPIYKRVWFWLLAILLLIVIVAVVGGGGGSDPQVSGGQSQSEESAGGSTADTGPTFAGRQDGDTVAEPGQTITLDDVATTATPLVEGDSTFGPTLCTSVTIVNNGDDSASFNPFDYKLQDPAGAARTTTIGGSDTLLSSGELAPGGTATGDVCFENATATPGQYALIYEPTFSFSGDRAVWVSTR